MKLRLRLAKENIFISHLDFIRSITRALRRSGLPLRYTAGCHPRVKLSTSPALALGVESRFEYVDIELTQRLEAGQVLARLNGHFPEGIRALEIEELLSLRPALTSRKSLIRYRFNSLPEKGLARFEELKRSAAAGGPIKEISLYPEERAVEIAAELGPEGGLNPVKFLREIMALDQEELAKVKIEKIDFKEI